MKIQVQVKGTEALIKNLHRLSPKVRDGVEKAGKVVGMMVLNDAKYMCPVDTGRLRASISINWTGSGRAHGEVRGNVEARAGKKGLSSEDGVGSPESEYPKGFVVVVGTNVEYAEDVEDRSPYLWPAFAMNEGKYLTMMTAILKMELERI